MKLYQDDLAKPFLEGHGKYRVSYSSSGVYVHFYGKEACVVETCEGVRTEVRDAVLAEAKEAFKKDSGDEVSMVHHIVAKMSGPL